MDEKIPNVVKLCGVLKESGIKNFTTSKYAVRIPIVVNGHNSVIEISFTYYRAIFYASEIEDTRIEVVLIDINGKNH